MAKDKNPPPPPEPKKKGLLAKIFKKDEKKPGTGGGQGRTTGPAEDPRRQAARTTHQSFEMEAGPGSRRVGYRNCRCSAYDSDHLR
jgi:hypothetical protein